MAVAVDVVTTPFPGVGITRIHRTLSSPRTINAEILIFDLNDPRIEFLVTPGDPTFRLDYTLARTTTFVSEWGLDGAVNANFWTGGLGSEGDTRDVIGLALSEGYVVHPPTPSPTPPDPALIIRDDGSARCDYVRTLDLTHRPADHQGVSGIGYDNGQTGTLLVTDGVNTGATARPAAGTPDPRTVAGVSADGRTLVVAAIDGRTSCSGGMTLIEAADLLREFGVWDGVNLDGGGSTTMVLRLPGQPPAVINCTTGSQRAVANHLGFRVIPAYDRLTLVRAFAFGATDFTRPVHNQPSVSYTKLRHEAANTASLAYDAGRGYGYTNLAGLDPTPNDNSDVLDGDQIYAECIGVRGSAGTLTFRVDVPNGTYRFVAAGGNVAEYNHVSRLRVRNGGGTWVNLLDHEHADRWTVWRVGFADKVPPPADGAGHDAGTTADPRFRPIVRSPVIAVTSGYLEFEQIARGVYGMPEPLGGDLCLLEIWRLDQGRPDIDVSPSWLRLRNTPVNTASYTAAVTVSNHGDAPLDYSASFHGADAWQFEIVGEAAGSVAPGRSDDVIVRFVPGRRGDASAELRITSDDPDEPVVTTTVTGFALADPPPDFDEDGDVDVADFGFFQGCFNGPDRPHARPECEAANFDGGPDDEDVDVSDFVFFQACFNGASRPPGGPCS